MMMKPFLSATMIVGAIVLSGCEGAVEGGLQPYKKSPDTVIATAYDSGHEAGVLKNGEAAIAYDPDGCQGWIIDDGVEGYSGRRFDPVSGLPVCNNRYPPGTVVKNYQTADAGIKDWVPSATK